MKAFNQALALSCSLLVLCFTGKSSAQQYVNGYERSNGTYVQGYYRSQPDGNVWNNYSTRGNMNPYTGQQGTVNPYSNGGTVVGGTMNNMRQGVTGWGYTNSGY